MKIGEMEEMKMKRFYRSVLFVFLIAVLALICNPASANGQQTITLGTVDPAFAAYTPYFQNWLKVVLPEIPKVGLLPNITTLNIAVAQGIGDGNQWPNTILLAAGTSFPQT
jgi:hypothetical protein